MGTAWPMKQKNVKSVQMFPVAVQEGGPDAAGPSPFDSSSGFGKGGAKGPGAGAW